jgi:hypothetical protein
MGDGRWEMGAGSWEMGDGSWEMGDGRWEMGDGSGSWWLNLCRIVLDIKNVGGDFHLQH